MFERNFEKLSDYLSFTRNKLVILNPVRIIQSWFYYRWKWENNKSTMIKLGICLVQWVEIIELKHQRLICLVQQVKVKDLLMHLGLKGRSAPVIWRRIILQSLILMSMMNMVFRMNTRDNRNQLFKVQMLMSLSLIPFSNKCD